MIKNLVYQIVLNLFKKQVYVLKAEKPALGMKPQIPANTTTDLHAMNKCRMLPSLAASRAKVMLLQRKLAAKWMELHRHHRTILLLILLKAVTKHEKI